MHIVLTTDGTWGDVLPFMFLAKALQNKGHEVRVFSNEFYEAYAQEHAIPFTTSTNLKIRNDLLTDPNLWHPTKGLKVIGKISEDIFVSSFPVLEKYIKENKVNLLVSYSFTYATNTLAEIHNIPCVSLFISPIQVKSLHRLPVFFGGNNPNNLPWFLRKVFYFVGDFFFIDHHFGKKINQTRKAYGLKPISSFIYWATSQLLTIGLWPEWYARSQPDQLHLKPVGFPQHIEFNAEENIELSTWLKQGTTPILVTLGSGYFFSDELQKTLGEISAKHHERFIFVAAKSETKIISPNLIIVPHVKLSKILPQCKLIIHHGGAGTLAQGVNAGIPHLIMPFSHDQPDNAFRVEENKLGKAFWNTRPSAQDLYNKIQEVLADTQIIQTCKTAAEKSRQAPSPIDEAVKLIENLFLSKNK